ncbi:unnamed protein product, partial [Medioppia subpectinata]
MASNQMIGSDSPRRCKRARTDPTDTARPPHSPPDQRLCAEPSDGHRMADRLDRMVSSSSDAEIMSDSGFDSGFQEFVANIDPKESDSTND